MLWEDANRAGVTKELLASFSMGQAGLGAESQEKKMEGQNASALVSPWIWLHLEARAFSTSGYCESPLFGVNL